jgi:DNA/RNA-binding protein KIN17
MRVFAENPHAMLDEFSRDFESGYLETLSSLHGTKRVPANKVYQEYIADKQHIHMNATTWSTLTGFCMYLGREGKAIVDETEKGWFIQYIDRDPKLLARQALLEQHQQLEYDEESRRKKLIGDQIKASEEELKLANKLCNQNQLDTDNGLQRNNNGGEDSNEKIALSLFKNSTAMNNKKRSLNKTAFGNNNDDSDDEKEVDNVDHGFFFYKTANYLFILFTYLLF